MDLSPLQQERLKYQPELPEILKSGEIVAERGEILPVDPEIATLFPHSLDAAVVRLKKGTSKSKTPQKVGVLFSGGQAAGGHNVVTGLFDALGEKTLIGFLNGPKGLLENKHKVLDRDSLALYRNQGGFDLLGSGRTKIETPEQFEAAAKTVQDLNLNGLVIIGGDDSNTSAALLADFFKERQIATQVIGVPKTIDGDLKNRFIEISFGFDTASKTFSETVGSLARDALSAKKYTFFIKLMGRTASHLTLETALKTHPNMALIGEEIKAQKLTLQQLTNQIADLVEKRSEAGKDYGVILIPEGVVEFIPEFAQLLKELNANPDPKQLTEASKNCYGALPKNIQEQLLLDRDSHGNVQVSKIETERLFIAAVEEELKRRNFKGSFSPQAIFCGYEGRACLPSNFDATYCYALGATTALLLKNGVTGAIAALQGLDKSPTEWIPLGVPLVAMMQLEVRKGKSKPVIAKALVNLQGAMFKQFETHRATWALGDDYSNPGPIQFFGPKELTGGHCELIRG